MKTTVEIPDRLFQRAKKHCAEHSIPFRVLVENALWAALDEAKPRNPFQMKPFGFDGEGQLESNWDTIREWIYEGRGGTNDRG